MKLLLLFALACLTACSPRVPPKNSDAEHSVAVAVLRDTKDDDIMDVGVLCVDGIKYIMVPTVGMSIKFIRHNNKVVPEKCVKS